MPSERKAPRSLAAAAGLLVGSVSVVSSVLGALTGGVSGSRAVLFVVGAAVLALTFRLLSVPHILGGFALLTYGFLFVPIVVVLGYAFNAGQIITVWAGFSTKWFSQALNNPQIVEAIGNSAAIAVGSALLSVSFACAAALVIGRAKYAVRLPYEGVLLLTLVVPEVVLAIGLLLFYMRFGVPFGPLTAMVGHAVFGTSVALLIVRARYTGTGLDLEHASADLGAGPWATLWQVTLPRLTPALLGAFLLTFVLSFDNVVTSQFTAGGTPTWPLYLLSALKFGVSPEVNAASALLLVAILGVAALTALVIRRLSRVSTPSASTAAPNE
ncbi:ABC transporter, solute-binding protein [Mycolicibacterium canariasense]|uniref:Spermidine/putrescine transport system permease protein PotC n=1 Tax=Mycolicibacterium canariasense TaxID=228230 RepID=A0A124E2Y9_MYCCR|nr:ABC transporter permease [Mycolicibacterium canariasense]MCV7211784.1 ABC transporter permease [Mycolicibacterium canariasense]ORV08147.1 hypothetical protein AWB94_12655 [Mycolicibacterium canariasense]GAS98313.1 ABC transporter, solute-binding protein [Mycolicibacterium canariasense]